MKENINIMDKIESNEYLKWLKLFSNKIESTQLRVALTANSQLTAFYWWVGEQISGKQEKSKWGDKVIEYLSIDLKKRFPQMTGLSKTNLKYCKRYYAFYKDAEISQQAVDQIIESKTLIGQQAVDQLENNDIAKGNEEIVQQLTMQIPWSHNINIFTKSKDIKEAVFYINQTLDNNWGRETLAIQIKSNLYKRKGNAVTNFKKTLPLTQSDLAIQSIKDPYVFDFMTLTAPYVEKDIENQLIQHVTKFLLELGKGFAFIGKQYHLNIGASDYYLDLLFYHTKLKCYIVIELKNTKFIPEYTGKMNFYLSAVDKLVKDENDNPSMGIILCRDKNNIEAEFALNNINAPMGISEMVFAENLPENLKTSLPTIEEMQNELKKQ